MNKNESPPFIFNPQDPNQRKIWEKLGEQAIGPQQGAQSKKTIQTSEGGIEDRRNADEKVRKMIDIAFAAGVINEDDKKKLRGQPMDKIMLFLGSKTNQTKR